MVTFRRSGMTEILFHPIASCVPNVGNEARSGGVTYRRVPVRRVKPHTKSGSCCQRVSMTTLRCHFDEGATGPFVAVPVSGLTISETFGFRSRVPTVAMCLSDLTGRKLRFSTMRSASRLQTATTTTPACPVFHFASRS